MPRVETHEGIPLPLILGGPALVGGAALPAMGGEKNHNGLKNGGTYGYE